MALSTGVNGCFDLIHPGHVQFLRYASGFGPLIVMINSDKSIKRLKGPGRPVMSEGARKQVLEAIKYVDEVYIFDEDTPSQAYNILRPDIVVKGYEYKDRPIPERSVIEMYGGRIVFAPYSSPWHTSDIVKRLA